MPVRAVDLRQSAPGAGHQCRAGFAWVEGGGCNQFRRASPASLAGQQKPKRKDGPQTTGDWPRWRVYRVPRHRRAGSGRRPLAGIKQRPRISGMLRQPEVQTRSAAFQSDLAMLASASASWSATAFCLAAGSALCGAALFAASWPNPEPAAASRTIHTKRNTRYLTQQFTGPPQPGTQGLQHMSDSYEILVAPLTL